MTDLTREWIAKREQLEQAATEGPWRAEYSGAEGNCVIPHDAESTREAVAITRPYRSGANAEFIAAANPATVLRLLDALEAVLELHEMGMRPTSMHYNCEPSECDQAGDGELRAECEMCGEWWPCPTVRAVEAALRGES